MNKKVSLKLVISIISACLVSFCGLITETAVNIAFTAIMEDFSVTVKTVQWLTTGNLLAVACITPLAAFLQKRFKIKNLFIFSVLCFIFGSLLAIVSTEFWLLLVARILHGIAVGVGVPLAFCIILGQVPTEKTGTFIGFGALVSAAAPALGPTFGGTVVYAFGWKYVFILIIPILIITLIMGICTIEQVEKIKKVSADWLSIIEIMLTFFLLVYGFANLASLLETPLLFVVPIIIGFVFLLLFIKRCNKIENTLIDIKIFKNKAFVCHLCGFFLINCVMLGTSFLLPNYLQTVTLTPSMTAGLMLLPGAAANAIMGPVSGKLLDKIGPKRPILIGNGIMTIGMLLFMIFGINLSPTAILIFYIVFGIGCGTAFGNTMTVSMMQLKSEESPSGNTSLNTLMQFAGAVGTSVCAALVSLAQTNDSLNDYAVKTATGSTYGFIFLFAMCVICFILQILGFMKQKTS